MDNPERNPPPRFIQLPDFARDWDANGLGDDALRALESAILAGPESAPVIRGTGGLQKIRFAVPGGGRGKSGSYPVAYYARLRNGLIVLALLWAKNEKANMSAEERNRALAFSRSLDQMLEKGEI